MLACKINASATAVFHRSLCVRVLELYELHELSFEEIARQLGLDVFKVRAIYRTAVDMAKREFKE